MDNPTKKVYSVLIICVLTVISILFAEVFYIKTIFANREIDFMDFVTIKQIVRETKEEPPIKIKEESSKIISLKASWYQNNCCSRTECTMANGDIFDDTQMTAAFNLVPLGEIVKVRYGDKIIRVEITDRISKKYSQSRIDLSKSAFEQLEKLSKGLINVEVIRY